MGQSEVNLSTSLHLVIFIPVTIGDINWVFSFLVNAAGPGVDGAYGPYRQSERNALYKQYAEKLLESGYVYRCFCSSEVIVSNL